MDATRLLHEAVTAFMNADSDPLKAQTLQSAWNRLKGSVDRGDPIVIATETFLEKKDEEAFRSVWLGG